MKACSCRTNLGLVGYYRWAKSEHWLFWKWAEGFLQHSSLQNLVEIDLALRSQVCTDLVKKLNPVSVG